MKVSAQKLVTHSKKYTAKARPAFPYIGAVAVILIAIANIIIAHRPPSTTLVLAAATADPIAHEIEFWSDVVRLHPTYRDGYIELAELYLAKDLKVAAKQAIDKAIEIDPLSDRARSVAKKIEG